MADCVVTSSPTRFTMSSSSPTSTRIVPTVASPVAASRVLDASGDEGGGRRRTRGRRGGGGDGGSAAQRAPPRHWYVGTDPDVDTPPPAAEPGEAGGRSAASDAVDEFRRAMDAAAASVEPGSAPPAALAYADGDSWRPAPDEEP